MILDQCQDQSLLFTGNLYQTQSGISFQNPTTRPQRQSITTEFLLESMARFIFFTAYCSVMVIG